MKSKIGRKSNNEAPKHSRRQGSRDRPNFSPPSKKSNTSSSAKKLNGGARRPRSSRGPQQSGFDSGSDDDVENDFSYEENGGSQNETIELRSFKPHVRLTEQWPSDSVRLDEDRSRSKSNSQRYASRRIDHGDAENGANKESPCRKNKLDQKKKYRTTNHPNYKSESSKVSTNEEDEEAIDSEDEGQSEEDGLLEEDFTYESFPQIKDSPQHSSFKDKARKILWVLATVVIIFFLFYDDENQTTDDTGDVASAKAPYSYHGMKDGRIPDDDVAQYGGGLFQDTGVFGDKSTDEETGDETSDENDNHSEEQPQHHQHEKTGIFQVDTLWEDLDGYTEMVDPYNPESELPVYWHVPKAGGTTLQDLMMHCFGMIGANEVGGMYAKDAGPLEVVKLDNGNRYVNVDMSNPGGINHANELGFGQSGLADVVMTSWFYKAAELFKRDNGGDSNQGYRGRCFAMMRHPIRRAISMFYYLKNANWEHTYSEVYKNLTIEEYAVSIYAEDNWMVRFLTNEMSGALYDRHLDLAKEIIESKCLIGLLEDFRASVTRFDKYFGWSKSEFEGGPVKITDRYKCEKRVLNEPDNAHPHPNHEEGGDVWELLMEKNRYDVSLYEHAKHLFYEVQNELQ